MTSWAFRRSSTRSLPQATHATPEQLHGTVYISNGPPRYSNLASTLEESTSQSSIPASLESGHRLEPNCNNISSRFSAASWSTQLSSPSYRTNDPETRSISSSTRTVTNPPRYSTLSQNSRAARDGARTGGEAVSTSEYTFDIIAGFKSERWATLRLYDERSSASRTIRKTRHPTFSNMDTILGSVDLRLPSPQIIRNIVLKVSPG